MSNVTGTTDWKDPLNRMIWQTAFKQRAKKMTLRDGKVFKIDYEPGHIDKDGNAITKAWVQIDGWISNGPCGWFVVEKVLDPTWVGESAGQVKTSKTTGVVSE